MKLEKSFKKTELAFCMYHQKLHWLDFKSKVTAFRSSHHPQWEAEDTADGQKLCRSFQPLPGWENLLGQEAGSYLGPSSFGNLLSLPKGRPQPLTVSLLLLLALAKPEHGHRLLRNLLKCNVGGKHACTLFIYLFIGGLALRVATKGHFDSYLCFL